jgi:hypothetical protein
VTTIDRIDEPQAKASLPLDLLAQRCADEVARYRRGEPCDDTFAFELFRRAVQRLDERAWQALHGIFHEQVLAWCRLATPGYTAEAEELVCITWEKFWL